MKIKNIVLSMLLFLSSFVVFNLLFSNIYAAQGRAQPCYLEQKDKYPNRGFAFFSAVVRNCSHLVRVVEYRFSDGSKVRYTSIRGKNTTDAEIINELSSFKSFREYAESNRAFYSGNIDGEHIYISPSESLNTVGAIVACNNSFQVRLIEAAPEQDKTPPTGTVSYSPSTWTNQDVTVIVTCSDSGSGCKKSQHKKILNSNGNGTIQIEDNAGNKADISYNVTWIDKIAPHSKKIEFSPKKVSIGDKVTVIVYCEDNSGGSGCKQSRYTKEIKSGDRGSIRIYDNAGNYKDISYYGGTCPLPPSCSSDRIVKKTGEDSNGCPKYSCVVKSCNKGVCCSIPSRPSVSGCTRTYISSYCYYIDKDCNATGKWDNNGTSCKQQYISKPVYDTCGYEQCRTTCSGSGKDKTCSTYCWCVNNCPSDATNPGNGYKTTLITIKNRTNPGSNCSRSSLYANNIDNCYIQLDLHGDPLCGKGISWPSSAYAVKSLKDRSGVYANSIDKTGESAVNTDDFMYIFGGYFRDFTIKVKNIKAYAPIKTNNGIMDMNFNNGKVTIEKIPYSFLKPYIGKFDIVDEKGNPRKLIVGIKQTYQVSKILKATNIAPYTNLNYSNMKESIRIDNPNFYFSDISDNRTIGETGYIDATMQYKGDKNVYETKTIYINPYISYNFGRVNVKYQLTPDTDSNSLSSLSYGDNDIVGLKIIGLSQGHGKQKLTNNQMNLSSIDAFKIRNGIRKKTIIYIRDMKNGDILNGVKYVIGDYKASDINNDLDNNRYETLVIKEGNLVIDENLNPNNKKLGIILISDNPTNLDITTKGFIIVESDVTRINGLLYTDKSFVSGDKNGNIFLKNDLLRNNLLRKQLIFKGILITKNTIGGAIVGNEGKYMLPGGKYISKSQSNFEKSQIYDLNYIRIWNDGWDKNGNNKIDPGEYINSFIVIYDPSIKLNPPKLFEGL